MLTSHSASHCATKQLSFASEEYILYFPYRLTMPTVLLMDARGSFRPALIKATSMGLELDWSWQSYQTSLIPFQQQGLITP